MSITNILRYKQYPKKIAQLFRKHRWKNGVQCQKCASHSIKRHQVLPNGIYKYRCRKCRRIFSDITGTIFEGTKLPLWKWLFAMSEFLYTSGINSIELANKIKKKKKTAWRMLTKIRESLLSYTPILEGIIEADECYYGGRQKGGKGRRIRWSNKTCVAGVVERKGKAAIDVIHYVNEETLTDFVQQNVKEDSIVYTDAFGGYNGLNYAGFYHDSVDHNKQFVKGKVHTQTIECLWSHIKRKLKGVYYRPSAAHLLLYLQEYVFRYNHRGLPLKKKFSSLLSFALRIY